MTRIFLAALLAVPLLGGCAEGELSREEYIARADEICAELDQEIDELGTPETEEELDEAIEELRRVTQEAIAELRDLEPPAEDRATIDEMLDRLEEALDLLPELVEAGKQQDLERLESLSTQIAETANEAARIAQEYGFEHCGVGSVTPAE